MAALAQENKMIESILSTHSIGSKVKDNMCKIVYSKLQ
jgi:hypothetical protein